MDAAMSGCCAPGYCSYHQPDNVSVSKSSAIGKYIYANSVKVSVPSNWWAFSRNLNANVEAEGHDQHSGSKDGIGTSSRFSSHTTKRRPRKISCTDPISTKETAETLEALQEKCSQPRGVLQDIRRGTANEQETVESDDYHLSRRKETRRNILKCCLPPILQKLGFQFSSFSTKQQQQPASGRTLQENLLLGQHVQPDTHYMPRTHAQNGANIMRGYHTPLLDEKIFHGFADKAGGVSGSADWRWTSPTGMARERIAVPMTLPQTCSCHDYMASISGACAPRCRSRSSPSFLYGTNSRLLTTSTGIVGIRGASGANSGLRLPAPGHGPNLDSTGRRFGTRADFQSNQDPAANLFKDMLSIIWVVTFVVSGTYAFAISYQHMGMWFKRASEFFLTVKRSTKDSDLTSSNASGTSGDFEELNEDNFVETIQKRPTFILFFAPWCPFCQDLDPTWKELANILDKKGYDVQLAKLNAEKYPNIADNFRVKKYPTFIFFKDGVAAENGQFLGPRTTDSFMKFIDEKLGR